MQKVLAVEGLPSKCRTLNSKPQFCKRKKEGRKERRKEGRRKEGKKEGRKEGKKGKEKFSKFSGRYPL
jgi:hypothetical protein